MKVVKVGVGERKVGIAVVIRVGGVLYCFKAEGSVWWRVTRECCGAGSLNGDYRWRLTRLGTCSCNPGVNGELEAAAASVVWDGLAIPEGDPAIFDGGPAGAYILFCGRASLDEVTLEGAEGASIRSCCFAKEGCCLV